MKSIVFDYENSGQISNREFNGLQSTLSGEVERMSAARAQGYDSDYASINLSFDEDLVKTVCVTVRDKKSLHPTTLVVIGIGGSNLGTIAVLEALRGRFYNEHQDSKVYFADTVDSDTIASIAELVERELATGNNILLNVISKSGKTTETIANFEIFLEILKRHRPYNYHQFVVATTDQDSALWHLARKEEYTVLTIPALVGGRYSVFSAVGLFPLCFLDIDIKKLMEGARAGYEMSTQKIVAANAAATSALLLATHYHAGKMIHDTFLFSVALESVGAWYRQLSAESIGKAQTRDGDDIHVGLLPTISIGSTDLHSVAQLYLAGPINRFTTFIAVEKNNTDLTLPNCQEFESIVPNIQGASLATIMNAILHGTQKAYANQNLPFVTWNVPEKSAYYIGQFMQIKMIEIMYLGFLLNINPFDQPEVEKYKTETRRILAQE